MIDDICAEIRTPKNVFKTNTHIIKLRPHQQEALTNWSNQNRRGILQHATGSGKTFTSIAAIRESLEYNETPVIIVPSELLLNQWKSEINMALADIRPALLLCGAGYTNWKKERALYSWTKKTEDVRIVLAMMQSASDDMFLSNISQGPHIFLLADEVHRLGSLQNRKILNIDSGARLGLSATPKRAGDPEGTRCIMDYFGGIVQPPYTLKDAINSGILTPYLYFIHKIPLSKDEQEQWDDKTNVLKKTYAQYLQGDKINDALKDRIHRLAIERARIIKKAERKQDIALRVINDNFKPGQKWLVYCDDQEQLNVLLNIIRKAGHEVLEYHSQMTGNKEQTIKHFEINGGILISIKCLDEGVDIPSVTHALILASSKNPREFIQRRGRVLRTSINKPVAILHDCIVIPNNIDGNFHENLDFVEGEIIRAIEFGKDALNPGATIELKRIILQYGLDYDELREVGIEDE